MLAQPPRTISPLAAAVTFFQGSGVVPAEASQLAHLLTEFCGWQADPASWSAEGWSAFVNQLPAERQPTATQYRLATQFLSQFPASQIEVALPKFVLALKLNKCSNSTVRNYRSDISQFFTFCRTSVVTVGLTKNQIAAFERFQDQNGLQPSSIKRKTSSLQHFWQWCEEHGLLQLPTQATVQAAPRLPETPVVLSAVEPAPVKPVAPAANQPALESKKPQVDVIPPRPRVKKVSTRRNWKQGFERLSSVFKASQGWVTYLNLAILVLFILGLGVFGYQQFFKTANTPLAYPSTPVEPNRILSFQGRLTDTNQNPITTSTSMVFSIYNHPSNGAYTDTPGDAGPLLWQGSCSVTPDQDGIFNTNLGDGTCGTEINEFVFSENASTYLEVRVGSETLTPRQPIRTVAYALNAETLQGYPISATGAATVNTILFMDGGGSVVLGEVNPEIRSISGTFTLEGRSLLFQTSIGSNGDIVLDADGIGGVISRDYVYAPGATISATYAGGVPLTVQGGPSGTAHIADINNSSGTNLAYFGSDGALTVTQAAAYNSTLQANTLAFSRNAENYVSATNATGSLIFRTGGSNNRLTISSSGNFDFATGTTAFNGITYTWPGSQASGYILSTNGSGTLSWVDPALAGAGSVHWSASDGVIYPKNSTMDVLIGGQSSASAIFKFLNMASGIPTASFSGSTAGNSLYLTGDGTIATSLSRSLLLNPNDGNVGIGTTSPRSKLQVSAQNSALAYISITSSATGHSENDGLTLGYNGGALVYNRENTPLTLATNALSRVTITGAGLVGIGENGVTSPRGTLDLRAMSGTLPIASVSGATSFATLVADNSGVGDIFTASSSGQNRFVVKQNGSVGIGTTIPGYTLDVNGTIYGYTNMRLGSQALIALTTGATAYDLRVGSGFTTSVQLGVTNQFYLNTATGNLGVGTASPAERVDIAGNLRLDETYRAIFNNTAVDNVVLDFRDNNATVHSFTTAYSGTGATGNDLILNSDTTSNIMVWERGGNVGVGTTAPVATLDVRNTAAAGQAVNAQTSGTSGTSYAILGQALGTSTGTNIGLYARAGNASTNQALYIESLSAGANNYALYSAAAAKSYFAGSIGIGTTVPGQALHVVGNGYFDTSAGELTIQNTGSGSVELYSSGSLVLDTAGGSSIGFQIGDTTLATIFNNNFGIGDTSPAAMLTVGNGDLFQVNSSGNIAAIGGVAHALANSSGNLVLSSNGELYLSDTRTGNIALTVADTALDAGLPQGLVDAINEIYGTTIGNSLWSTGNGALYPVNSTLDLLIGGQSTASARFAVTNVNSGAVTATMSGTTAGYALSLNGDGAIQTSLNRTLTLNATGGRVGIGTSSPDFDFAVGSITTTARIGAAETGAWPANTDYAYFGNQALSHSATGNYALLQSNVGSTYLNAASGRQIFFALNNSVIGAVSSAGNWGIGPGFDSTNATATLDVAGSASLSGTLSFRGTTDPKINILNDETFGIRTSPGGDAGLTERLTVLNNGNVGIGTTAPSAALQVVNSTGPQIIVAGGANGNSNQAYALFERPDGVDIGFVGDFSASNQAMFLGSSTSYLQLQSASGTEIRFAPGGTDHLRLHSSGGLALGSGYVSTDPGAGGFIASGNVGIGTTAPLARLSVNGDLFAQAATVSATYAGGVPLTVQAGPSSTGNALVIRDSSSNIFASFGAIDGTNEGHLALFGPAGQGSGSGIDFSNSGGTYTGLLQLDSVGNIVLRQGAAGSMYFDYNNGVNFRQGGSTTTVAIDGSGNTTLNAQADLRLADSDSTNYAAIQAPTTIGTNYTLTLPDTDGNSGEILSTDGSGVLSWVAAGTNYWGTSNGSLFPLNSTVDVFFGGQASASANFAFLNNNSGTPTASIAGSLTLNHASGAIQSTNNRSLTIGGSTTGNIIMMPNNGSGGRIAVGTTAPEGFAHLYRSSSTRGYSLDGNDMLVLEAFSTNRLKWVSGNTAHQILSFSDQDSEDSGVINYMHDIDAMGFATNGTTAMRINSSQNIGIGTTTINERLQIAGGNIFINAQGDMRFGDSDSSNYAAIQAPATIGTSYTLTLPDTDGDSGQVLSTDGSGVLSWTSAATLSNIFWYQNNGALYPANSTVDVLFGGQASTSANFAFINNSGSGTPTASISGNVTLNSAGVIATTNQRTLTIGDANTGNLQFVSDGTTAMTVLPSGNVGIGTTVPLTTLDVGGNASVSGNLTFNGTSSIQNTQNRSLTIGGDTTGNLLLRPLNGSGRVGINTTTPLFALQVNGQIFASTNGAAGSPNYVFAGGGDGQTNTLSAGMEGGNNSGGGNAYVRFGTFLNGSTTIGNYMAMTRQGNVGFGTTAPLGRFVVTGTANAAGNAMAMFNQTGSDDIFTASASGTPRLTISNGGNLIFNQASTLQTTTGDLTLNIGGGDVIFTDTNTFNVGGSGSDVAYNVIGDSTAGASGSLDSDDDLYIEGNLEADGTVVNFTNATVTASDFSCNNCLNFSEFSDSLTLDAATTLSQGSSTWQQTYSGNSIGYTYSPATTGGGIGYYLNATSDPQGSGVINPIILSTTNTNSTGNGTIIGTDIRFTNNPTAGASNIEYAARISNTNTSNTVDTNVTALLLIDNLDTSSSGSTVAQNGLLIQNSGNISGGIVNAINIDDADITTDIVFQNDETIDNDVDGTLSLTAGTVEIAGNLLPDGNDTRDLGSDTLRWQDLYLGPSSLHIGSSGDEGIMSYNTTSNYFNFDQSIVSSGQIRLGNSASDPTALGAGSLYYNTTNTRPYYYNGSSWVGFALATEASGNYWRLSNGAFSTVNDTADVLIGGSASSSADFAFINVNSGTPTASISGNVTLNSAGVIATTNQRTLTLGDANTGNLSFVSDGTTIMTMLPTGNVGIGTTAPNRRLIINSAADNFDANSAFMIQASDYGINGGYLQMNKNSGSNTASMIQSGDNSFYTQLQLNPYGGNVGINTTNAQHKLTIVSGADDQNTNAGIIIRASDTTLNGGYLFFNKNSGNNTGSWIQAGDNSQYTPIYLNPNGGNIAIGTTTASYRLDVNGTARVANLFRVTGASGGIQADPRDGSGTSFQWYNPTGDDFRLFADADLLSVNTVGNVGLGTTAAHGDLHIVGNYGSNAALVIDQLNSGDIMTASVSGVTRFRIDTNGYAIAQRFSDMANDAFYLDPAATGTALNIAGDAIFGADAILNIGGNGGTVNYNLMADSTAGASGSMTTDNDLYIQSDLEVDGTTVFGNLAYTWPSSQTAAYILQTNGSGTLSWVNPQTAFGAYWQVSNGALSVINSTLDLLVGGNSTSSANFRFLNNASGTPVASISGNVTLNAAGALQSTLNQTLTIGGNSTGNLALLPGNGTGRVGLGTSSPSYLFEMLPTSGDSTFALGDPDIAHGVTGQATTTSFLHVGPISSTDGGAQISAFADQVVGAQALELRGISGSTNPTDTIPMIRLTGARRSGTGLADLAAAETVFQVRNNDNAADLTLLGNGDLGIGTTAPAYGLHFQRSTTRATMMFRSFSGGDPYAEFQMSAQDGGASNIIFSRNDGATELGNTWQISADTAADEFILNNYYLSDPGSNGSYALHIDGVTNRTILGDSRSFLGLLHLQTGGDTPAFGKAVLTINQTESNGDLFTASASGTTRFVLTNSGGMGVNTPSANLLGSVDIRGYSSSLPIATFSGSTSGIGLRVENNGSGEIFRAGVSGRHVMSIRNNGAVAIGTTQGGTTRLWVTSEGGTPFGASVQSWGSHTLVTNEVMTAMSTNDVGTASEYFMLFRTDEDGTPDNEFRFETNGQAYADQSWNASGADVAEMYKVLGNAEAGDLVAITPVSTPAPGKTLTKSNGIGYDNTIVGVISTSPGLVAGWGDADGKEAVGYQPVALMGRVPVKVSLENGPIAAGDPLTSGSQPGVAMKATKAGRIIGYALEAYDGTQQRSAGTIKVEAEWVANSSERQPLPAPQAGTGKIMVFVNTSYFDPSIRITSSGDVTITGNDSAPVATATYNASYNGNLLEKVDAYAQLAVANLKAGVIRTRQLLAEVRIQTPEVQTDLITPVGDTVNVKLSDNNDRFQVTNQNNQPVASIDNQGNTELAGDLTVNGTSRLGSLLSDNASISGTATFSGQLDATSARIAALEGKVAEFEQIKADTAELVTATISGTLYADNIDGFDDKVATAIQKPSLLAQLLGEPDNASTAASVASLFSVIDQAGYSASGSAIMNKSLSDLNLASTDVSIGADAAFINRYFEVNGSAYFGDSVGIANQLLIGEGTQLSDGVLSYLDSANPAETVFEIQPHGQGTLSMMAGLLSLKSNGQVIVTGDLTVAGNVTVEDSLLTDLIQPTDFTNPLQVKIAGVATESGEVRESRFEIVDELGTPVATISADGRANFAGGIGVGAQDLSGNENQAETTKTSGKAVVKQGQTEMVIKSEQITSETVVQVTPLGSTNNQVLYVKSITPENPGTSEKEGQFVVGFDTALPDRDVQFTWWLLN